MSDQAGPCVVILEDDELFRRSIVRALDHKGLRLTAPEDFKSAIETIEQTDAIDLLIADIGLWPGAPHGVALGNMAQLRRNGLKVIYMSGTHDVKWAAAYGDAAAVLQKPFTAEKLVETVMAVLEISVDGGA
jgi:DNA-binding NtrC family response regulator